MRMITPEQWLRVDWNFPVFYNGSADMISIHREVEPSVRKSILVALPGYIVQLHQQHAFFTKISPEGDLVHHKIFPGNELLENEDYDIEGLMRSMRGKFEEILLSVG
jgi:hypothetical protein